MQNNRKRKRSGWKIEHIIGMAFVVCIVFFLVLNIIVPNKEMSEEENRMLAGRPKLTIESLVSGDFMDKFETYQADQFVGRNTWRKLKTALDRIGGSKEENGVLIGKKGQLMEEIATPDQEQLNANLKSMKSFAKSYPDINTSVMPLTFLFIAAFVIVVVSMSSGTMDNMAMKICSFIPFTSPIAMFTRIAMSTVPIYEIIISIAVLIVSVFGIGILSAKIYRVGVLLYGMTPKISTILKAMKNA